MQVAPPDLCSRLASHFSCTMEDTQPIIQGPPTNPRPDLTLSFSEIYHLNDYDAWAYSDDQPIGMCIPGIFRRTPKKCSISSMERVIRCQNRWICETRAEIQVCKLNICTFVTMI